MIENKHLGAYGIVIKDEINDDSLGAEFFDINSLSKNNLSLIAILELEKLGYKLKWISKKNYLNYKI